MIYGYHRTSTADQHLDRGIKEIEDFCKERDFKLEKIYTDQQTGKNFNRPRYTVLKQDVLRAGDTLIITEVDRLGRNKQVTLAELKDLQAMGVRIMILELPTTCQDFSKLGNDMAAMLMETVNNMLVELYASIAEAELLKKEKRQREGIEAMKERGEWYKYGRPQYKKPINWDEVITAWKAGEIQAVEAQKRLGMKPATFYKKLKEWA